jgi:excisionase family DNA binding protein
LQRFVIFATVFFGRQLETKLSGYLLIKEAAEFVGVSKGTLRNWSREHKLPTHRHPINGYRLYRRADLEALLAATKASAAVPPRLSRPLRKK